MAVVVYAVYWTHIDRLQALGLWITIGIGVWLFYPLIMLFIMFASDEYTEDNIIDCFETFVGKCIFLLGLIYKILVFATDLTIKILTTIGSFIPFT